MADSERLTVCEITDILKKEPLETLLPTLERFAHDERSGVTRACAQAHRRYEHMMGERSRVQKMYDTERRFASSGLTIGVDEVGRGPLAGPLCVCALSLPLDTPLWGINDSKQLTARERACLAPQIKKIALAYGISFISPEVIDDLGMSACIRKAMTEAIAQCGIEPVCVLIDGVPLHIHPKERTIVKGDSLIASIAAASIVAKVERDALMDEWDEIYPEYHFASNKGYGSAAHIEAIKHFGLTPIHRKSFCTHFI